MKLNLSNKVTWLLVAVLGISLLTVGAYAVREQEGLARDLMREWVRQCSNRYLEILGQGLADADFDSVIKTGKALVAGMPVSYCEILTKHGDVAFREGFDQTDAVASFVWPVPYQDAQGMIQTVGRLTLVLSPGPMTVAVSRIGQTISMAGLGILFVGLFLGGLAIHSILGRPIRQLVAEADRMVNQGDLDHRLNEDRQDEIGLLAKSINTLTDELRSLIHREGPVADATHASCVAHDRTPYAEGAEGDNQILDAVELMKNHVEQHGGRFWIESEPGKLAEFHFTLPEEVEEMHKEGIKEVCK